jgi:DNA-binding HxlR family transcriptional regulator
MEKDCGVLKTIDLIGSKWAIPVMWGLCTEPKGFNQLSREIEGISPRVLSTRLKELVENGLVSKKVFPTNPPQVEYALTEKGLSLKPILNALEQWGQQV